MFDHKDFTNNNNFLQFDISSFFHRVLKNWIWFVIAISLGVFIAYQVNIRKQPIYGLESSIVVKDENNPFFTSNTSLVFNWGGVSQKVQTVITQLKSRSHNEKVVKELKYYIQYFESGKYYLKDIYGQTPFKITLDTSKFQALYQNIELTFLNDKQAKLTIDLEKSTTVSKIRYDHNYRTIEPVENSKFEKIISLNTPIRSAYFNGKITLSPNKRALKIGTPYLIRFDNFDHIVSKYKNIKVITDRSAQSVIRLQLNGTNKYRLVEYLNTTVKLLKKRQLENKNQFAINTINFIDSTLIALKQQLQRAEKDLKDFRKGKNLLFIKADNTLLYENLQTLDFDIEVLDKKIQYLKHLNDYLTLKNNLSNTPAPSVIGIEDPNIIANVSKLIELEKQRFAINEQVKSSTFITSIETQMLAIIEVLKENIKHSQNGFITQKTQLITKRNKLEKNISSIPEQQQDLLKITRAFDLKEKIYHTFLEKRSEAEIVKAANISDIEFIDPAKDVGAGKIGPRTNINYIIAIFIGTLLPFFTLLMIHFLDQKVNTNDDILKLTNIPIIGSIGKKTTPDNLNVFRAPKSPIAESFRSIRSSLHYIYKTQNSNESKTLMITSSVSGEGKTFCSINIATVFALSGKKTIIVGLDLRKPKIFDDFKINSLLGVVNYLIGQKTIPEIIQKTEISNLDIITSGPVPPNPSELLMSEKMTKLIEQLKKDYQYIILDTPPVGLVADPLELTAFSDATLYVVRQGYTKKSMLNVVNQKHQRKELKNISILVNNYKDQKNYTYGYGHYYEDQTNASSTWIKRLLKK